jgi:hypothetical protein
MPVNPFKIVGWVAIAIAVVGAFVDIPYAGTLLVLLGLVAGYAMAAEDHVRVLVSALVLTSLSGVFVSNLPEIGSILTSIFSDAGTFAAGAALMIVSCNVWRRYKP